MSFLTDRITNWVDNLTRDPVAEEKNRKEKAAIDKLILTYRPLLTKAKEDLLIKPPDTYSDFDMSILNQLNSERSTLLDNKAGLTADDFKKSWTDTTREYDILSNPKGRGRFFLSQEYLNSLKQGIHDAKPTGENKKLLDKTVKEMLDFLNENTYTDSDIINTNYLESTKKKIHANKEVLDILVAGNTKIRQNKLKLDFQEEGGPPVPAEVLKTKAEQEALEHDKTQDTFSVTRMLMSILRTALSVFILLLIIFILMMGASFAVNLNIYKPVPFRILYAIYGTFFALVVVPYTLLYRWAYKGLKPKYYGFIPLIPRFFVHRPIQFLLGWLTYKPDEEMWDLEEWRKVAKT